MKILVLTTSYPKGEEVEAFFVHTRNLYYASKGHEVTVLNFNTEENYFKDGIKVISPEGFSREEKYDLTISHAPNLKNHYKFLTENKDYLGKIVFFFHGHEVLKQSKIYPPDYDFVRKNNPVKKIMADGYDSFKLLVWKRYFRSSKDNIHMVFVSQWMKDMFLRFTGMKEEEIRNSSSIIYNSVGKSFEKRGYNPETEKKYDFVTIRGNIDGSKYCIDLINNMALRNPDLKFKVIGKGKYFDHNIKAENIVYRNQNLTHSDIILELDKSRAALLPTRTDAQGVMACEVLTYGIPLVTSEIPVCKEVFGGLSNVALISNVEMAGRDIDLKKVLNNLESNFREEEVSKYLTDNTIEKELQLFKSILSKS